jgi:hypothetical protein
MGVAYPAYDAIDQQYVTGQEVPTDKPVYLHYDDIFDRAVGNVAIVWSMVVQAVFADSTASLPMFGDWNLDDGRDEYGMLVFW